MIDDRSQYNNIPFVPVSENEDVYGNEDGEYWFSEDDDEDFEDNDIIDFSE